MSLRTTLFSNRSGIIGTIISVALTGALMLPVALQNSAAQADRVKGTTQLRESTGLHHEQLKVYPAIVKERIDTEAAATLEQANAVMQQATGKADLATLTSTLTALTGYDTMKLDTVRSRTDAVKNAINVTSAAAAAFDRAAAAKAAVAAAAAAATLAAGNTPDGARSTARSLAASTYGWGDEQFQCLNQLWQKESGWSYTASNGSSGATGIPQALPGSKMASAGSDWQTNATTQIVWGLGYIAGGYGTPCAAWSHSQSMNWY